MKKSTKTITLWIVLLLAFAAIYNILQDRKNDGAKVITFSRLLTELREGQIDEVRVSLTGGGPAGEFRATGREASYRATGVLSDSVLSLLEERGTALHVRIEHDAPWTVAATTWVPMLLIVLLFFYFLRQLSARGAGSTADEMKKAPAAAITEERKARFTAVADAPGVPQAKETLLRLVASLTNRPVGQAAEAPPPVLLSGPPGSGKTLLVHALAGEIQLPVLAISGTDFLNLFVGVGAGRMRDLFAQARKQAPCVVFIDQLDAIAKARAPQAGGERHDEREQTLSQLLQELDALRGEKLPILLLAATDRADLLDEALLTGGRFGHHLRLERPDEAGRLALLTTLVAGRRLDPGADLAAAAAESGGLSGADLRNLIVSAEQRAASRGGGAAITRADLEAAAKDVRAVAAPPTA
jgi:cell division protease FtsH